MKLLTAGDLIEASFPGIQEFPHFSNPDRPSCFACNSRLMMVRPLLVVDGDDGFVLLEATTKLKDGRFVVMPYTWLIYPRRHGTSFMDLPRNWTATQQKCVRYLTARWQMPGNQYNVSTNNGFAAGQRVQHPHSWIQERSAAAESGLPCQNLGHATTLFDARFPGLRAV